MRSNESSAPFVGILAVLAILSCVAAFSTSAPLEAEPSAFETNALVAG